MRTLPLVPACLAVALACLPLGAAANTESKPGAKPASSNTTQAAAKAQRCAELKRKIAAYNEAAKKGGKPAGSETIKQDIAWVDNC